MLSAVVVVQAILAERTEKKTRRRQVLVKWAGSDLMSATWEPLGNMSQLVLDELGHAAGDG